MHHEEHRQKNSHLKIIINWQIIRRTNGAKKLTRINFAWKEDFICEYLINQEN